MGSGRWSTDTYGARAAANKAAGRDTFDYSATMQRTVPRSGWKTNELLDPKSVNKNGPHTDQSTREAYDNDENPEALAIGVFFDVTGSMHQIPTVLQKKLPSLHGLLLRKGYVENPQLLFGAIGDAYCDAVPLQVGQFEADNRMDEQLEKLVLEGGGGGQMHESYELALYYMARHTDLDCFNKRGKKGYLFLMGDEMPYKTISRKQVKDHIGDDLEADLPTAEIVKELGEHFNVFFLFVAEGSYSAEQVLPAWKKLLGERAMVLDDASAVCETIALTLGVMEDATDLDQGIEDLEEFTDRKAAKAAGKALAPAVSA